MDTAGVDLGMAIVANTSQVDRDVEPAACAYSSAKYMMRN